MTPTSYLELIKTFKNLLNKKRLELITLKDRYVVGLEKLEFSESQVNDNFWHSHKPINDFTCRRVAD